MGECLLKIPAPLLCLRWSGPLAWSLLSSAGPSNRDGCQTAVTGRVVEMGSQEGEKVGENGEVEEEGEAVGSFII